MPASDPLEILLAHNLWANRQIIEACTQLSSEQFHRRFEMGPGSLHDTVNHLLASMQFWGDMLAGREVRPRLEGTERTPAAQIELLEAIAADLTASARAHPVADVVPVVRGDKTYHFSRGGVLTHVTTHGMHHRAQCLNMLRHVGVQPLPLSSVVEWMRTVDTMA